MSGPRDPLRVRAGRRDEARGLDAVPRRRGDRQEGHRVCRQPGQGQVGTVTGNCVLNFTQENLLTMAF